MWIIIKPSANWQLNCHQYEMVKRLRLLLKHRVESEPQEAVRTEVNAYLQAKVGDDVDDDPLIFCKNAKGLDHLKQLAGSYSYQKCFIC